MKNAKMEALTAILKDAEEAKVEFSIENETEDGTCSCGAELVCKGCKMPAEKCDC